MPSARLKRSRTATPGSSPLNRHRSPDRLGRRESIEAQRSREGSGALTGLIPAAHTPLTQDAPAKLARPSPRSEQ
jgi:hypothetical protein